MSAKRRAPALAGRVQFVGAMTRFDRVWEPLVFVIAVAIVWIGTL